LPLVQAPTQHDTPALQAAPGPAQVQFPAGSSAPEQQAEALSGVRSGIVRAYGLSPEA
jgi:hypothetical protein